jgi:hypothetical protein
MMKSDGEPVTGSKLRSVRDDDGDDDDDDRFKRIKFYITIKSEICHMSTGI